MNNVIVLIGRIFLAVIFILAGFGKLADPGIAEAAFSTAGMIAGRGLPMPVRARLSRGPRRTARRPGGAGRLPDPHRRLGARAVLA